MEKTIKKILFALTMLTLVVAVLGGMAACVKGSQDDPDANCWVFVRTTPDAETILLAKSGLALDEAYSLKTDYESQYGKENVWSSAGFPGGINNWDKDYLITNPDAVTNCYEFTMTIDFSNSSVPSIRDLLDYGFRAVRFNGNIATCKQYHWAYTDEMAKENSLSIENSWESSKPYTGFGGVIIGSNTIKNLGFYVENERIEF
jgi:hypothetical protein